MESSNHPQTDNLTQQLHNLPTMSKEQILDFFKQDLTGLDPKKIIGNLEMLAIFTDPVAVKELKSAILENLSDHNKKIKELVNYLNRSTTEELISQIPMHFDFEDAKEVDQFRDTGTPYKAHNFNKQLHHVWSILPQKIQAQLDKDDLLHRRLTSIILTYLKDIRDDLETRQRLAAKIELGGMGFDYDLVDKIFAILKNPLGEDTAKLDTSEKQPKKTKKTLPYEDTAKLAAPAKFRAKQAGGRAATSKPNSPISLKPISLDVRKLKHAVQKPQIPQPPEISKPSETSITITHTQSRPRQAPSVKKLANKVTDIKYPEHTTRKKHPDLVVISPVEEFSNLTLDDLRRAESPASFTKAVLDKINALSDQDFSNRAKSIAAWHRSKLYQEYVEIGQKSLEQNKTVDEYLADRPKNSLTRQEFEAIGELNQKLRF